MEFSNAYALVIGVGTYEYLNSLPTTVQDAEAVTELLIDQQRCAYPRNNVRVISEADANKNNIIDALKTLAGQTDSDSTVLIYFSGHGMFKEHEGQRSEYLCPREADPGQPDDSAISGACFSELVAAIEAKKLLILIDACHAAGMASLNKSADQWKSGLPGEYLEILSRGSGSVVIASSTADQQSYIKPNDNLSIFTKHLLDALKGEAAVQGSNSVHVLDVFTHLSKAVPQDEPKQTPILKANNLDSNFAIALLDGGKGSGTAHRDRDDLSWLKNREFSISGRAQFDFSRRLGDSWVDLAMILQIPSYETARFDKGHEAKGIWTWLDNRRALGLLPNALEAIDRSDLLEGLKNP